MKFSVDFKVTTWERIVIHNEDDFNKIIKKFKEDGGFGNGDVYDITEELEYEQLEDTTEEMTVAENDGENTIELMKDGLCIWGNADELNKGGEDA